MILIPWNFGSGLIINDRIMPTILNSGITNNGPAAEV